MGLCGESRGDRRAPLRGVSESPGAEGFGALIDAGCWWLRCSARRSRGAGELAAREDGGAPGPAAIARRNERRDGAR